MSDIHEMNKKRNITFFIGSLGGGGAERICVNLANKLASDGFLVSLVVFHLNDDKYSYLLEEKVRLINLNTRARYVLPKLIVLLLSHNTRTAVAFSHEVAILLVIARMFAMKNFRIVARNINNLKHLYEISSSKWSRFVVQPLVRMLYPKVDFVINQCRRMEDDLVAWIPSLKGKTNYIYNPYTVLQDNEELNEGAAETYLLCVGRLEPQKGFHYAIEGFSLIKDRYPKLMLYFLGEGSLEHSLRELAQEYGVIDRVKFLGYQKNINSFYRNARATVLTSLYEGFPNVLIESISVGTPVVAFDCPSGPSEIVFSGVNGQLVDYKKIDDLCVKLCAVLDCPPPFQAVIESSKVFSWENIFFLYRKVLIDAGSKGV